jgi:hypothetical protein
MYIRQDAPGLFSRHREGNRASRKTDVELFTVKGGFVGAGQMEEN